MDTHSNVSKGRNRNVKKTSTADVLSGTSPEKSVTGRVLSAASFSCGTCVMVLEMAGSRVVAPYMGTSLVVWTSLIGIIMTSLALGYWLGGVVSDRWPYSHVLACIIGAASVSTAVVAFVANLLLAALVKDIRNIYVASVIASLLLFAPPSFLLGMVSPFIVRLAMRNLSSAGTIVGRFSALSSAGSILGTFLGGFVLISFLQSSTILLAVAVALGLTAFLVYPKGLTLLFSIVAISIYVRLGILSEAGVLSMKPEGVTINTRYNSIRIMERTALAVNRRVRMLQTDPMGAQSLMYIDNPNELFSDYTKFYDLAFHYKPDVANVLMLGGGGYCVPKHLGATKPDVRVDVVELDPGITAVAREYFNLVDRPGMRIFHEDARQFVNRAAASGELKYDAIFGDVFGSSYNIPFHLTTVECMRNIRSLLSDDGVFIVNIISSIDGKLFNGIYSSIASVFPTVMIFPATQPNTISARQNVMIVALATDEMPVRAPENEYISSLLGHRWTSPFEPNTPAFTDSYAPVERYSLVI
ncbi:MAG: fused MFS/spermidine synthase [Synergistaceae bacterium]|jgi:spermidine synthase|nr:fused MFS/spermidine synthase [Synergistaceae bacterium]